MYLCNDMLNGDNSFGDCTPTLYNESAWGIETISDMYVTQYGINHQWYTHYPHFHSLSVYSYVTATQSDNSDSTSSTSILSDLGLLDFLVLDAFPFSPLFALV